MAASTSTDDKDTTQEKAFSMKIVLAGIRKKFKSVSSLTTDQLHSLIDAGVSPPNMLLLDVREKHEYDVSRIPQANWINESWTVDRKLQAVHDLVSGLCSPETETQNQNGINVVAYCSIGYRSSALVKKILELERFNKYNFYNLEGGIFQWANEKRSIVNSGNEETEFVHPYNAVWGKLLHKQHRQKNSK